MFTIKSDYRHRPRFCCRNVYALQYINYFYSIFSYRNLYVFLLFSGLWGLSFLCELSDLSLHHKGQLDLNKQIRLGQEIILSFEAEVQVNFYLNIPIHFLLVLLKEEYTEQFFTGCFCLVYACLAKGKKTFFSF